ncbi:6-carboxyhexanoate--CoA ligase [Corynebacterium sp. MSK151]|uniref:6-carboxyhexanoate--CoA ligase n=1 Tax=unclassified Corynebacterium TaxID=2624378 RepID=UPI0025503177|nr:MULTISPECIES: 6-carboxyhexanoate--CoA ligase [unclassified Corynebacterium]MDK8758901.1 6-carboxyhexanoate--CoA ligase [Corynebacterium sp. MSK151]MDK8848116.1 6-carboxyhexanoate--CoA ligase [Corynebacterium sp. MSK047]
MSTYSIRMRSSADGCHISGAERLAPAVELPQLASAMTSRALHHDKGRADTIHITVDKVEESTIGTVSALTPFLESNPSPEDARNLIAQRLHAAGIQAADIAVEMAYSLTGLRGAALIDASSGERLDPNPARGVRVSTFDAISHPSKDCTKDHFHEALILASKVHSAPGIVAEICLSDDPFYTRGYLALDGIFHRIPNIKDHGSTLGTRIFIVEPGTDIPELIDYLENAPVYVELPADASSSPDVTAPNSDLSAIAAQRNTAWAAEGLARTLRTFETGQLPHSRIDGTDYLLFSSSDYLGLSTHPELISAATEAIGHFGTGSGGSRLTTGTSIHSALENELARFFGFDDAVLFATGYQANHSTIAAIATADVEIFSDAANHASIIDGCSNARAKVTVFPHADYQTLDRLLAASSARHKLVISDSVFSMSGEVIDGPALERTCRRHNAWLMLDDAHGVGVIGEQGRGTASHLGIHPDIVVGTASKALGVEGGYVLCSAPVGELLRNQARSFVYSTSMNPGSVAAIRAALKQLEAGDVVKRLQRNIARVRSLVDAKSDPASAIIPLPVGDEAEAMDASARLAELDVYIPAIRYPTVPRGEAMLRLTITALHTDADIDRLEQALRNTGLL